MFIKEITFSILKTTPLHTLTGDIADQYANIKPHASVTVGFSDGECDPATKRGKELIAEAYSAAQDACFEQLVKFHTDFTAAIKA